MQNNNRDANNFGWPVLVLEERREVIRAQSCFLLCYCSAMTYLGDKTYLVATWNYVYQTTYLVPCEPEFVLECGRCG